MARRGSTERFLERAFAKFGTKFDYSKVVYEKCNAEVIICCPVHGDFLQTPTQHLASRHGCRLCASENMTRDNLSRGERVAEAKRVYGSAYDYSSWEPDTSYLSSTAHCNIHCVDFEISYYNHVVKGQGCPLCMGDKISNIKTMTHSVAERELKKKHNHLSILKESYKGFAERCKISCDIHGEFEAKPQNLIPTKHGCPLCAEDNGIITSRTLTTEEFLGRLPEKYHNLDFSNTVYTHMSGPITFRCKTHNIEHTVRAGNLIHSSGLGCPICNKERVSEVLTGHYCTTTVERNKEKLLKEPNHVYVTRFPQMGNDVCKIGVAMYPPLRMKHISRGCGSEHEVLILISGSTYDSFYLEQRLHDRFRDKRFKTPTQFKGHTEFFTLNKEDVGWIKENYG